MLLSQLHSRLWPKTHKHWNRIILAVLKVPKIELSVPKMEIRDHFKGHFVNVKYFFCFPFLQVFYVNNNRKNTTNMVFSCVCLGWCPIAMLWCLFVLLTQLLVAVSFLSGIWEITKAMKQHPYIQKAEVLEVRTPQIILSFRKVIVWERANYQICCVEFCQEEQ